MDMSTNICAADSAAKKCRRRGGEGGGQKVQLDLIISTEKSQKQGIQCILYMYVQFLKSVCTITHTDKS